jgi:hypothetical protein
LYAAHIAVEDHEVFPTAARILSGSDLHDIGREMASRRSIGKGERSGEVTSAVIVRRPSADE